MARRDVEEDMRSRYTDYSCVTPLEQFTNELEQLLKRWRVKETIERSHTHDTAHDFDGQLEGTSFASPGGVWEVAEIGCPLLGLPGESNPKIRVEFLVLPPSRTSTTEGEAVADSAAAAAWQLNEADDVKALGNRWACDRCGADAPGLAEWFAVRRCVTLFLPRSTSVLAGWGNEPTSTDRARCKSALGALIVACGNIGNLGGLPLFAAVVVPSSSTSCAATTTTTSATRPVTVTTSTTSASAAVAPQRHRFGACDVLTGYMLPDNSNPMAPPMGQREGSSTSGDVFVFEAEQRNQPSAALRRLNGLLEVFNAHADRVLGSGSGGGSAGAAGSPRRRNSQGRSQPPSSTATATSKSTASAIASSRTVTRCSVRFSWRWEQSLWHAWVGADSSGLVAWRAWPYRNTTKDSFWMGELIKKEMRRQEKRGKSSNHDMAMQKIIIKRRWRGYRRMQARLKCLPQATSIQSSSNRSSATLNAPNECKSNNSDSSNSAAGNSFQGSNQSSGIPGQRWTLLGDARDPLKALEVTACWPGFTAGGSWMETPSHTTLRPRECPMVRVQAIWADHHDGYSNGSEDNNSSGGGASRSSGGSDGGNFKLSPSTDSLDTNDPHTSASSMIESDGIGNDYGGSERSFGGESEDSYYSDSKYPSRLPQPLQGKSSLRSEGARALRHAPPLAAKMWALLGAWCHAIALEESATPHGAQAPSCSPSSVVVMADLCRFPDLAHAYEELSNNGSGGTKGRDVVGEGRGTAESPSIKGRDSQLNGFETADALASSLSIQARASVRTYRRLGDTSPQTSSEMAAAVEWLLRPDIDGNGYQDESADGDSDTAPVNDQDPRHGRGNPGASTRNEGNEGDDLDDDDLLVDWASRPLWLWSGDGSAPVGRLTSCLALWLSNLGDSHTSKSSSRSGSTSSNTSSSSSSSSSGSGGTLSGGLGGSGGIASGWAEFCAALREHWESRRPIPHLGVDLQGADIGLTELSTSRKCKSGNNSDKDQHQDENIDDGGFYSRPQHLAVPLPPGATAPDRRLGLLSQKLQFLDACIRCAIEDEKDHDSYSDSSNSHSVAPISIPKPSAADLARASSSPTNSSPHSWDWSGGGPSVDPIVGARVVLHGLLAKPALNGVRGKVVGWSEEAGRYEVETEIVVDFQALFMVKKRNLKIVESSSSRSPQHTTGTTAAAAAASITNADIITSDSSPALHASPFLFPQDKPEESLNTSLQFNANISTDVEVTMAEEEVWADADSNDTSSVIESPLNIAESTDGVNVIAGTTAEEVDKEAAVVEAARRAVAVQKTLAAREAMLLRGRMRASSLKITGVRSLVDDRQDVNQDRGAAGASADNSTSASTSTSSASFEANEDPKTAALDEPRESIVYAPMMPSPHAQDNDESFGSCEGSSESDQDFEDNDLSGSELEGIHGGAPAGLIDDASADGSGEEGRSGSLEPLEELAPSAVGVTDDIKDEADAKVVLERLLPLTSDMVTQRRAMLRAAQQADDEADDGNKGFDKIVGEESSEGLCEGVDNSSTVNSISSSTPKTGGSGGGLAQGLKLAVVRADMKAFRRARPRASLQAFRAWYSPDDEASFETFADLGSSSSSSNGDSRHLWALPPSELEALWDECNFSPESERGKSKPLFAVASEAEKALHSFETATASHVLLQLLLALVPATHFALTAALLDLRHAAPPLAQSPEEALAQPPTKSNAVTLEASVAKLDLLAQQAVAALAAVDDGNDNEDSSVTNVAHSQSSVYSEEFVEPQSHLSMNASRRESIAAALTAVDAYTIELARVERRASRALALGHRMSGGLDRCAEANLIDGQPAHLNRSHGSSSSGAHASREASISSCATARATVFNFLDEQHRNAQGQDRSTPEAASGPLADDSPQTVNTASLDMGSSAPSARSVSSSSSTHLDGSSVAKCSSGGVLCPPAEREYVFWRCNDNSMVEHSIFHSGSGSSAAEAEDSNTTLVRLACAIHEADTFPATRSVRLASSAPRQLGV